MKEKNGFKRLQNKRKARQYCKDEPRELALYIYLISKILVILTFFNITSTLDPRHFSLDPRPSTFDPRQKAAVGFVQFKFVSDALTLLTSTLHCTREKNQTT